MHTGKLLWPMEDLQLTHPIRTGQRPGEHDRHGEHAEVKTVSNQATAVGTNPERSLTQTSCLTQELSLIHI
eukprot:4776139-Karenia_brevis.AAC.1